LAVNVDEVAKPLELVVSISIDVPFANVPVAPVVGAVNVTTTPLTGFELLSSTTATSGDANAVLIAEFCGEPLATAIVAGAPAVFVRLKFAGVVTPAAVAVTIYAPEVPFALNVVEVATPAALVVSVSVAVPFANVPLAPVAGAANVTSAPLTGFCPLSTTVATRGAAKAVLIGASCGVPLVARITAGPPVVLVRLKPAGVGTPKAVAMIE
jgi:hypothetical protein